MKYPSIHCLHPKRIVNKYTKEVMYVPCMSCQACNNMKGSFSAMKCNLESKYHKFCYFGTLTYSNTYVPLADVFNDNGKRYLVDICGDGEILGTLSAENPDYFDRQIQELKKTADTFGYIPYLRKRDVQLFNKRLRKYIYKRTNEKVRFYTVGEYGPLHRRPHFHFLVWFEKTETKKIIRQAVRSCWSFGRVDCQKPKHSPTQYVAGYINGNCDLPEVYKSPQIRPFACHSQFLGEKVFDRPKEEIYQSPVNEIVRNCVLINGNDTEVNMWRSLTARYFPIPKGYYQLTTFECLYAYRIADTVSQTIGKATPYEQARVIVDYLLSLPSWPSFVYQDYEIKNIPFQTKVSEYMYKWFINTCDIDVFNPTDRDKYIQRVYSSIRISRHFLDFVCEGDYSLDKTYEMVDVIRKFYNDYAMFRFEENQFKQAELIDAGYDIQDFEIDNGILLTVQKDSPMYKEFLEKQIDLYNNRVKHKKQNEKSRNMKIRADF